MDALLGGVTAGPALVAENGRPPVIYAGQSVQLQDILDSVATLSTKATLVLDDADKIVAENSPTIHSALANVDQFPKALADNSAGVDAALKSVANSASRSARWRRACKRFPTTPIGLFNRSTPMRCVQSSGTSRRCRPRVSRSSIAPTSFFLTIRKLIQSTLHNADVFSKALADDRRISTRR